MNKQEKVEYMKDTQKYIEEKQLIDIFENLTQELIINQPENPIKYLIDVIKEKSLIMFKQIYCIIGGTLNQRNNLIQKINSKKEFKILNIQDYLYNQTYNEDLYFLNDQSLNIKQSLISDIKKHQKLIVQGYPYDLNSSYHLQRNGIIPTKIFVINNNLEEIENQIFEYLNQNQKQQINIKHQTEIPKQVKENKKIVQEEEIDIDLNDAGVQNSASLIQKQFRRQQQKKSQENLLKQQKEQEEKLKQQQREEELKRQNEQIDIDLNDIGVQNSAALIQKQFRKKQKTMKETNQPKYGQLQEQVTIYSYTYIKNIEDVQKANQFMHTKINVDQVSRVQQIIALRNKPNIPIRNLRILVLRPSNLKQKSQKVIQQINENLDLVNISSWELINNQIKNKSEIGKYSDLVTKKQQSVPDDIISALIYTELNHIKSKVNGFILEGYPKTINQFNIFNSWKIIPHLVVVFIDSIENLKSYYRNIYLDEKSGLKTDTQSSSKQVYSEQQIEKKVQEYHQFVQFLEKNYQTNKIIKFNMNDEVSKIQDLIQSKIADKNIFS